MDREDRGDQAFGVIEEDTIAAISTSMSQAGIGIVRMSGEDAFSIADQVFRPVSGKAYQHKDNRRLRYGHIVDGDQLVDEVLVSYMEGPYTYTREDIVEINTHGGAVSLRRVLDLVLNKGARLAEPGEFTRRAFLNGRMDLAQAEATLDIINARTEKAQQMAEDQLAGSLSSQVHEIKEKLLDLLSHMEYAINFMEDAQEDLPRAPMVDLAQSIREDLDRLLQSSQDGRLVREGINTVIVGKPNVGKSSLLNAILKDNRAIVTDVPGTTRDSIEESYNLDGILFNLVDTAGIRTTEDLVESMGVDRTLQLMDRADLVLVLVDGSKPLDEEDRKIFAQVQGRTGLVLVNKEDLGVKPETLSEVQSLDLATLTISAKQGSGLDQVKKTIQDLFFSNRIAESNDPVVTNIRHIHLLQAAKEDLDSAISAFEAEFTLDAIEVDVRSAYQYLAEITGEAVDDDVLNKIFNDFCIGK